MLLKKPNNSRNCTEPIIFTKSAREAFGLILKSIDFNKGKLLIPAYIGVTDREGSGVFDPIQETQTPYGFYKLDRKLRAIKSELFKKIRSGNYCALLVIHYFGFCQNDMDEIIEVCVENNVLVIEDCAHAMLTETKEGKLGFFGDFSFFSIHKFLPTPDGGFVRINNSKFLYILDDTHVQFPLVTTIAAFANSNTCEIGRKRRDNYQELASLIGPLKGLDIMYEKLDPGVIPHSFPIIVKKGKRESIYFKLIENEIPVFALYYRMIDSIKNSDFKDSLFLSDNILNIPIHQDVEKEDLAKVYTMLEKILAKNGRL